MRIMTVAFALGTALVLCNLGTFSVTANAQKAKVVREPRERPIIRVPVVRTTPYWDYYIVPRYRYRPEDDRVDPCGEIGRVRVKAGNAPIEQKISAYPPQVDICAFVSTSLETNRAAKRPSRAPDGQNANGSGWLRTALVTEKNSG